MIEAVSIDNAVRYGKLEVVRQWARQKHNPERLGKLLLSTANSSYANTEMLSVLLEAGANPNFIETHKMGENIYQSGPPLSVAANHGTIEKVKTLVEAGANIHYLAPHGFNAINSAAYNFTSEVDNILPYLIALKIDLNIESKYNETALSVLSHRGLFHQVKMLLDAGANPSPLGWNKLMHAIALGTIDECRAIIKSGDDIHVQDRLWQRTPFLLSIQVGDVDKASLLLDAGAKLDDKGRCGKTNLMHAAPNNHAKMIKWLISKGADIHAVDDFETTALIEAARFGATECVNVLLNAGADVHAETHTQSSAITEASNIETVTALTKAGADINKIAGDGYNLLMSATEARNYDFVDQLLKTGANPNVTSTGEIPLHKAVYADNIEIMRLLLRNKSNPNAQDVDGYTPLHSVKSIEAAQVLLDAGADPSITDMFGKNAIDKMSSEIAGYIKSRTNKYE